MAAADATGGGRTGAGRAARARRADGRRAGARQRARRRQVGDLLGLDLDEAVPVLTATASRPCAAKTASTWSGVTVRVLEVDLPDRAARVVDRELEPDRPSVSGVRRMKMRPGMVMMAVRRDRTSAACRRCQTRARASRRLDGRAAPMATNSSSLTPNSDASARPLLANDPAQDRPAHGDGA